MSAPSGAAGGATPAVRYRYDHAATCEALGLRLIRGGARFAECPFCGGNDSHQVNEHHGHCHRPDCGVRGSAIDLVACLELDLVMPDDYCRFPHLTRDQMTLVEAWFVEHGIEKVPVDAPSVPRAKRSAKGIASRARFKPELDALWRAAGEATFPPPTRNFFERRKLDRKAVVDLDLARALPGWGEGSLWDGSCRLSPV